MEFGIPCAIHHSVSSRKIKTKRGAGNVNRKEISDQQSRSNQEGSRDQTRSNQG
jgi:hypothetical protein